MEHNCAGCKWYDLINAICVLTKKKHYASDGQDCDNWDMFVEDDPGQPATCAFCRGEMIRGTGTEGKSRFRPIALNAVALTGMVPNGFGIHLDGEYMLFDNSCNEYDDGAVRIVFCPFCGRQVGATKGADGDGSD